MQDWEHSYLQHTIPPLKIEHITTSEPVYKIITKETKIQSAYVGSIKDIIYGIKIYIDVLCPHEDVLRYLKNQIERNPNYADIKVSILGSDVFPVTQQPTKAIIESTIFNTTQYGIEQIKGLIINDINHVNKSIDEFNSSILPKYEAKYSEVMLVINNV